MLLYVSVEKVGADCGGAEEERWTVNSNEAFLRDVDKN